MQYRFIHNRVLFVCFIVAIEKNRAEVVRLMEVLRKRATEAQARMHDVGASMQMVSNSNSDQG